MKKIFTLITAMLVSASLFASTRVIFTGPAVFDSWGSTITIDASEFENAAVGDIIKVNITDKGDDYNPIFKIVATWGDLTALQSVKEDGDGYFQAAINEEALAEIQANGLRFQGLGFTITSVELIMAADVPEPPAINWINLLLNGDCEAAAEAGKIGTGTWRNGNEADVYSFLSREVAKGDYVNIVDGAGVDGSRAAVVTSVANPSQEWDTQFFMTTTHKFEKGQKLTISFDYRADDAVRAATQFHALPGDYNHWQAVGDVNFTTEWQHFEKTITLDASMAGNGESDGIDITNTTQTLTFNLNTNQGTQDNPVFVATNYYFDNMVFSIDEAVATDEDLALAEKVANGGGSEAGSEVIYTGPAVFDSWSSSIVIEAAKFANAKVGDIIRVNYTDKGADFNPIYKVVATWGDLEALQNVIDRDGDGYFQAAINEEALAEIQANGLRFQGLGFTITTVELIDAATGISTAVAPKTQNGVRYNLAGQKVSANYKGIVIQNGKKIVVK